MRMADHEGISLFPQLGRKNAARLLDYALNLSNRSRDGKQERRPIVFHVFSNNGLYFYANLLQQIAQHRQVRCRFL